MTELSNSESEMKPTNALKDGAILTRDATDRMEMRVMSVGCTDSDFRKLMDSHESLRNIVAYYVERTQHG